MKYTLKKLLVVFIFGMVIQNLSAITPQIRFGSTPGSYRVADIVSGSAKAATEQLSYLKSIAASIGLDVHALEATVGHRQKKSKKD